MKKLVFATQVFGIIAMFPIVMILELNRSNVRPIESNSRSIIKQHAEIKSICLPENVINNLKKDVFPAIIETVLLQGIYKIKCLYTVMIKNEKPSPLLLN